MSTLFITTTPARDIYQSTTWYKDVPLRVQDYVMYANLIVINMIDDDINSPCSDRLSEEACALPAIEGEVLRVLGNTSEASSPDDFNYKKKEVV